MKNLGLLRVVFAITVGWAGIARAELPKRSVAETLELAKKSGRPILALAGNKSCGHCVALEQNLSSAAYQALASQYVLLKVDTSDSATWSEWTQKYPSPGRSIPQLYVVRADGKSITSQMGAPGNLKAWLVQHLSQAGKLVSQKELDKVAKAVAEAKELASSGKLGKAIDRIERFFNTGCFAEPCAAADQLANEWSTKAKETLSEASKKLDDNGNALEGALAMVETMRIYGRLPDVKKEGNKMLGKYRRDPNHKEVILQAEAFDKVRELEEKIPARAIGAYEKLITDYPDTALATLASERAVALRKATGVEANNNNNTANQATEKKLDPVKKTEKATKAPKTSKPKSATGGASASEKRAAFFLTNAQSAAKNDPAKAKQYAEKAIQLAPDSEVATKARELLEKMALDE